MMRNALTNLALRGKKPEEYFLKFDSPVFIKINFKKFRKTITMLLFYFKEKPQAYSVLIHLNRWDIL